MQQDHFIQAVIIFSCSLDQHIFYKTSDSFGLKEWGST